MTNDNILREVFEAWFEQEFECKPDFGLEEISMCFKAWQAAAKRNAALHNIAYHADILIDVLEDKNFNAIERALMINNLKQALAASMGEG